MFTVLAYLGARLLVVVDLFPLTYDWQRPVRTFNWFLV